MADNNESSNETGNIIVIAVSQKLSDSPHTINEVKVKSAFEPSGPSELIPVSVA